VRELADSLSLSDFIVFTGYLSGEALLSHISAFDIGVIPDPYNEANDVMSMNKVFEYCALGIPTASYPLRETKRLLGGAGVYAPTLDPAGLAEACLSLLQDDALRARCSVEAARLSAETFVWDHEAKNMSTHLSVRCRARKKGSVSASRNPAISRVASDGLPLADPAG
jgi:glycosyltransferase involved in cell wall biosynthesis